MNTMMMSMFTPLAAATPPEFTRPALLVILLVLLGVIAVIGPTITGAIAVSRIRRSNGRLTGLGFAMFGALLYPLLLLDYFIAVSLHFVGIACGWWTQNYDARSNSILVICSLVLSLVADWIIIRAVWRSANKRNAAQLPIVGNSAPANLQSLEKSDAGVPAGSTAPAGAQGRFRGLAIASLVLGIIGLIPFVGAPMALLAVLLGIVALVMKTTARGMAITGVVLGALMTILVTTPVVLPAIFAARAHARMHPQVSTGTGAPAPHLGAVTNGIGAEFTVPAGQVATFELVTRTNGTTVAIPRFAAYVLAPANRAFAGTCLFQRGTEIKLSNGQHHKPWRIEVACEGGHSSTGGQGFPDWVKDTGVGSSLHLGLLEQNRETVDWFASTTDDKLPDNGLVGLRIRTQEHGIKDCGGMWGDGDVDWQNGLKLHPLTSTAQIGGRPMDTGVEAAPARPPQPRGFWSTLFSGIGPGVTPGRATHSLIATLKSFTTADPTIATNLVVDSGGWLANCKAAQTIRLFAIPNPGVEEGTVIYRAKLKTENLHGLAYLELWCRVPGHVGYDSYRKQVTTGTTGWTAREITFELKPGEKPDLIRLAVVAEGPGKIWVKDVELLKTAAAYESPMSWDNVPTEMLQALWDVDAPVPAKPALPAPDADGWSNLFDGKSLANWSRHEGIDGIIPSDKFRISDGQIVLTASTNWRVITVGTQFPTKNYELEFEVMQSAGEQVCRVGLPVGDGLGLVSISDNLGSDFTDGHVLIQGDKPVTLAAGQWHKVHIRVADHILVTADGVQILDIIVGQIIGTPLHCEILKPFSLIAGQPETRLRNIRVRLLPQP